MSSGAVDRPAGAAGPARAAVSAVAGPAAVPARSHLCRRCPVRLPTSVVPEMDEWAAVLDPATRATGTAGRGVAAVAVAGSVRTGGAVGAGASRVAGDRRVRDRQRPEVADPAPVAAATGVAVRLVGRTGCAGGAGTGGVPGDRRVRDRERAGFAVADASAVATVAAATPAPRLHWGLIAPAARAVSGDDHAGERERAVIGDPATREPEQRLTEAADSPAAHRAGVAPGHRHVADRGVGGGDDLEYLRRSRRR